MTIRKMSLVALALTLPVIGQAAQRQCGLGGEWKDTSVSSNQQSGWWAGKSDESKGASCGMKNGCCCCGGARVSEGLNTELKDASVSPNQQSGWWYGASAPAKCGMKKDEPAEAAAPAAAPKKSVDSDGDGVVDEKDNCEGTPKGVKVDAQGCPQEAKAVPESNWTLQGVQFETGSDKLKGGSLTALDEAAEILKTHTRVSVEIQGHTDNVGGTAANQTLSDRRAASVKNYLVQKGIAPSRLEAKGYGESRPVADNRTEEGRAKNRRIEFKVTKR